MLVKIYSAALQGIDALQVTIEVASDYGISFNMVGLPDTAVKESYQRVMAAMSHTGIEFPRRRIVVNLSPADIKKEGAAYDLPIAVGILAASEKVPADRLDRYMMVGELSLDGTMMPVRGILPMAILARDLGFKGMILPRANADEAAVVQGLSIYGAESLAQVLAFLADDSAITPVPVDIQRDFEADAHSFSFDFSEVKGQPLVKRAFEVACAGGHNILLVGPPGSGKSMMAKRLPSILPPLTPAEALETTKIHSVAGKLPRGSRLMTRRPFRSPHHTISPVALVGGGTNPMPGEISLAHNGILFLDEFPEFNRSVLEVMRQPLEDRHISISRAKYSIDYPAGFMLVASMNPCPCGYYNHPTKACQCPPGAVRKYLGRISGPLLDRIDLQVEILPVPFDDLSSTLPEESSADIRHRVIAARDIQARRFADEPSIHCNAMMDARLLHRHATLSQQCLTLLRDTMTRLDMSARAYDRILKVARTIADLDGSADILPHHMREAIGYRTLDRGTWGTTPSKLPF